MKFKLVSLFIIISSFALVACDYNLKPTAKRIGQVPQKTIAAQKEPDNTVSIQIDQNEFHFQYHSELTKDKIVATMTGRGIVWAPDPEMVDASSVLDKIPKEPFKLYLNKNANSNISVQNSDFIYSFPLKDSKDNYFFLDKLYGIGNHVIITAYLRMKGVPQATICKLYDLNLDSKKVALITNYHISGGNFFEFGINKETNDIVYIQTKPYGNDYKKEAHIYHIITGKTEEIENGKLQDGNFTYTIKGKKYSFNDFVLDNG